MFSAWKVAEDSYNLLGAGIAISPIYRVFRKISGNTYLLCILDYSEVPVVITSGRYSHVSRMKRHDVSLLHKHPSRLLCVCYGVSAGQAGTWRYFLDCRLRGNDTLGVPPGERPAWPPARPGGGISRA